MKIQANISISRDSSDKMRVKVQDEASRATFLEMEFTLADFMQALTGLAYVDASAAEVRGLDVVGKSKVVERRSIPYPGEAYSNRTAMSVWLAENGKEDGWIVDPYLGSQQSISSRDGNTVLNYSVYRYEDVKDQSNG